MLISKMLLLSIACLIVCTVSGAEGASPRNSEVDDTDIPVAKEKSKSVPEKTSTDLAGALTSKHDPPPQIPPPAQPDPKEAASSALTKAGWSSVTGAWKLRSSGIYEVCNGRLEARLANGGIRFALLKGDACSGSVRAFVRNSYVVPPAAKPEDKDEYATGFGVVASPTACKLYTPYAPPNSKKLKPHLEREIKLAKTALRNEFAVLIDGNSLELYVNGKREKLAKYDVSENGPFVLEVVGEVVLEAPQAAGH